MSEFIEEDDFHVAEQAFVDGDLPHAIQHLAHVVIAEPERREARELFSRITAEADDPLALVALKDDNYVGTVALRSLLCARLGKSSEAVSLLLQCVQALPDSRLLLWLQEWTANPSFVQSLDVDATAFALHRFAFAITNPDRYVELLDVVENLRLIHPRHERLAYVHVFSLRRRGRSDDAVTIAREMFAQSDEYEWIVALGATYRDAGMLDEAAVMYERALAINDESSIFLDIADVHLEQGSLAKAIEAYESALEREPNQPWALSSLAFARYRETGDPVYLDELADRAANGDERAAALENFALPYFGYLPRPADATINLLEQLAEQGITHAGAITNFALSHIESPSSRMAADVFSGVHVAVAIQTVPDPDPRESWADVAFAIWQYDGTDPSPALDPPQRADVIDAVVAIAESAFNADSWYAAACDANLIARDEETLRELLAILVHPPIGDDDPRPWLRIQRVQFAAAMLIASLDRATAWPWSLRHRGLHALIHGPLDWTTSAAVVALTLAVRAGDADEKEALRWMTALYERRPSEGAWLLEHALLTSMLRMPNLSAAMRDRLSEERRMLALDDEDDEPVEPPPSSTTKKPFWKRWFGL